MSSQFDVYHHPDEGRGGYPWLVCLQSDIAGVANTVVIAPLAPSGVVEGLKPRAFPEVLFEGRAYRVMIPQLAAVPRKLLKAPAGNLRCERDKLLAAIDLLFTGI